MPQALDVWTLYHVSKLDVGTIAKRCSIKRSEVFLLIEQHCKTLKTTRLLIAENITPFLQIRRKS